MLSLVIVKENIIFGTILKYYSIFQICMCIYIYFIIIQCDKIEKVLDIWGHTCMFNNLFGSICARLRINSSVAFVSFNLPSGPKILSRALRFILFNEIL